MIPSTKEIRAEINIAWVDFSLLDVVSDVCGTAVFMYTIQSSVSDVSTERKTWCFDGHAAFF